MSYKTLRIIIFLLLSKLGCLFAQQRSEITSMMAVYSTKERVAFSSKKMENSSFSVFSTMFIFYKKFLSSQDGQSCTFSPSCSEYGLISVKKLGPIRGMLSTLDRLTRCNGISPEKYAYDPKKKLLIDPVIDY